MSDDLISRQAAVNALDGLEYTPGEWATNGLTMCKDAIKALPSAQPTGTKTVQVDDCISRAAIVDAIEGVDWYHQNENGEMVHGANSAEHQAWYKAEDIYKAIESMPSAQPEIIRCKDCEYGEQDEVGRWFCRSLGCQIGNEDGSGYCADAERRTDD